MIEYSKVMKMETQLAYAKVSMMEYSKVMVMGTQWAHAKASMMVP